MIEWLIAGTMVGVIALFILWARRALNKPGGGQGPRHGNAVQFILGSGPEGHLRRMDSTRRAHMKPDKLDALLDRARRYLQDTEHYYSRSHSQCEDLISDLVSALSDLRAKGNEDAERYRCVRDLPENAKIWKTYHGTGQGWLDMSEGIMQLEELDAAIDAARRLK